MEEQGHICCPCPKEKTPLKKSIACSVCGIEKKTLYSDKCRPCFMNQLKSHRQSNTPLYNIWKNLLYRYAGTKEVCDEWRNFVTFSEDVKEIHGRLTRKDKMKPFGKDNFTWK